MDRPILLFVCRHNAGRSQMSAALFERAAAGRHRALSAGSEAEPGGHVHPPVVEAMRELGIDLSDRRPQRLSTELAETADVVVTMGCGDACPYLPGKRYIDWELEDPKGRPVDEVRATRDDIARRVEALVADLDASGSRHVVAPASTTCERCGRPFVCGAADGTCWCADVELTEEFRLRLAATHERCLCGSCLRELAAQPSLNRPPSPANSAARRA